MKTPRAAFDKLLFHMPVPTAALAAVPAILPETGALLTLWRADAGARATHEVVREYHVGFDIAPRIPDALTFLQPVLLANPKELPA